MLRQTAQPGLTLPTSLTGTAQIPAPALRHRRGLGRYPPGN